MYGGTVASIVMAGDAALHQVTTTDGQLTVVACGCSPLQRARLQDSIRGTAQMYVVEDLRSLWLSAQESFRSPAVVVLAVSADTARDAVAMVRDLRMRCPRAALVAYCGGVREAPASIAALAAAGVHQFLFAEVNDRGATLRAIIENARQQCTADVVLAALRPLIPAPIHPMAEALLSRPAVVCDVRALAAALGVHRKTLFNRCTSTSFVAPAELVTWTRLALVAYLLETTGFTVERIALETGYPSPTALRNTMKRYTGMRATDIRAGGGLAVVIDCLRSRLQSIHVPTLAPLTAREASALHLE